ncbi:flagellin [Alphaproteobacteria bacterium]|nr:flagellin [Alphaproteobacteria bacterium]
MTVINTNTGALTARTYAVKANDSMTKAMERLASGLRINSAADDAAGLAVANKMESQLRGMNIAIRNSQDGISLVQTAEAGMSEISNMLIRMRELAVQMNNGIYTASDRSNAQLEVDALMLEVDKIANNTAFNDVKVLDGTYSANIRAGNTNVELIDVTVERMNTDSLGGDNLAGTKSTATADDSTAVDKVGTTVVTSTAADSITIQNANLGTGISAFTAANANGTYTLSGTDAASFSLDSANNIVSNAAIAFDTSASPKNSYDLQLTYTNQAGTNSFTENVKLNITANETIAAIKTATTNLTTSESAAMSFRATNSAGASDGILSSNLQAFVDADTGVGSYSVTGTDAAQITVDSVNGIISAALDFENKQDSGTNNVYDFNVVYTSSTGDKFTETVALTVTDSQEEVVTFTDSQDDDFSASDDTNVTRGDVFTATVDGVTLAATVTADDTAFTNAKLATLLNEENAQQATAARGTFSVNGSNQIVWTYADAVGNTSDAPNSIIQTDKNIVVDNVTTTDVDGVFSVTMLDTHITGGNTAAGDIFTLTVGLETLTVTGQQTTAAGVVDAFVALDTSELGFTLADNGNNLTVTMREPGVLSTPVMTATLADGTTALTNGTATNFDASVLAASSFTTNGVSAGRDAVAKVTTYAGLGAALNAGATGDTFSVVIDGTTISATVGAGVTAGTYGIASLVTDLNAANQALATPVAITFSASGSDLLATANNAASNLDMSATVQRNSGDVGTAVITTRAQSAVARTVTFDATGTVTAQNDTVEVTVNGEVYSAQVTSGGTFADVITDIAGAQNADGDALSALYTVTDAGNGADMKFTAVTAGAAANADTLIDFTYVEAAAVAITDGDGDGTHTTSVTQGVDTLVSVAATKVGSSTAGSATNTLFGNYSTQSSTFVTTANSSISLTEASKIEFGADALSAALNTYRTSSGKDGGTYSISGTDSAKFSVDKTSGLVTNVADMDADSNTSFTFDVSYTDKAGGVFTDSVTLNLLNSTTDDGTHLGDVDLTSSSSANTSITILDTAINQIASAQAKLGAIQNRLQHNIDNLSAASMLTETAKGRIVDADFARETTELSKQQILGQAATSMLAQANQSKQSVLALLQ